MRVRWTTPALRELEAIGDFIANDSPHAARLLVQDIFDRTEKMLSIAAESGRIGRVAGTRELVFADLPYIVVYRMRDSIEILAVIHTARDWPDKFH